MRIALIGYMGSGKTRLGKALSDHYHLPFFDVDREIEKQSGQTIADIVFHKGELFFRKLERDVLHCLLKNENFVLATGGGTPCYYDNIDIINASAVSIYLRMSVKALYENLEGEQAERPLIAHLKGAQLQEFIAKHLFERQDFYEKATFILKPQQRDMEERLKTIKELLT